MTQFWSGRRVLLTGHTGFKGVWLSLWLEKLGADVFALALAPVTEPNLFSLTRQGVSPQSATIDLRDRPSLGAFVEAARPQIVIHMAAQALVRESYRDPLGTFATNVMGTANLLDSLRGSRDLEAVLVVTTDKVYENEEKGRAFVETDRLGGKDPYSASKACAEIVAASMRASFFRHGPPIATARAGNVIGGGDWSADRIVPDMIRAAAAGKPLELRYPDAVRPWQHVVEPLSGYLAYAEALATGRTRELALNFGPDPANSATVAELVTAMGSALGFPDPWRRSEGQNPPESGLLTLDSTLARTALGWQPMLGFRETVDWTAHWHRALKSGADARTLCLEQIAAFEIRLLDQSKALAL